MIRPYRLAHKLPAVNATPQDPIEIDPAVAGTFSNHTSLLRDIAHLTANALIRVHDTDADSAKPRSVGS